jgi:predicted hotdog family 3-hydroxylacyl-ACP dehydratase
MLKSGTSSSANLPLSEALSGHPVTSAGLPPMGPTALAGTATAAPAILHDHAWIAAHIPHQGTMCLLDSVIEWDEQHIVCMASSHLRVDHPLRSRSRLPAVVAIEYAAQAMAAHGAVLAHRDAAPGAGFLTAVRGVRFGVDRLDTLDTELRCEATRVSGDAHNILYAFEVSAGSQSVARGRATVMLEAAPPGGHAQPSGN